MRFVRYILQNIPVPPANISNLKKWFKEIGMKISANILLYTNLEIFSSLYPSILRLTINDTNGITNADIPKDLLLVC